MTDLTTLEGADTPGKVRAHVRQGPPARPDRRRPCPSVAAVCVYPDMVPVARGEAWPAPA